MEINIKEIKSRLYDEHAIFIIQGRTHTGKSILLNYLMPDKYILHAECDAKVGKKSILLLDKIARLPVIGIDEVHYVDNDFLVDCNRQVRTQRIGMVIVCQDIHGTNLIEHLPDAITINTIDVDLRDVEQLNWTPTLKLVK